MPFVQRDVSNAIVGLYASLQPGVAEEFLPDNNPEVVAFLRVQQGPSDAEVARIEAHRADTTTIRQHLRSDTNVELEAYVRAQIRADDVTNLATAQQCLKKLETGQVILMKALASLLYGVTRDG